MGNSINVEMSDWTFAWGKILPQYTMLVSELKDEALKYI